MTEVPAGSALSRIEARRHKATESLTLDLAVPRYDPPIYVRFRPVEPAEVEALEKRFRGLKDKDRTVIRNAAVLVEACLGLFEKDDDDDFVGLNESPDPETWPRFTQELAEIVGIDADTAIDTVRGTYLTGYDVVSTAVRLLEWSGLEPLTEDDSGN